MKRCFWCGRSTWLLARRQWVVYPFGVAGKGVKPICQACYDRSKLERKCKVESLK